MRAREILMQCRTALTEITAIERQIDRLMSTGAPSGGGSSLRREKVKGRDEYITVGGTNNPEAARSQAVDGCEAALEARKERLNELLARMEQLLGMLADGNARTILRYYYGVGWSDERIADEMEMARPTVTNKRNAALDYLDSITKDY